MATWEDIICKARELADAAGRKVVDVADMTKQKLKIAENERAMREAMEALGNMCYDSRKGIDMNEELANELVNQIDELKTANEQLQADIDNRCGQKTCVCGAKNASDAAFCSTCGNELK